MKNLHLIKTDKKSRLFTANQKLVFDNINPPTECITAQHLYITSDDYPINGQICLVSENHLSKYNSLYTSIEELNAQWKKIILTTDTDLIKEGVQPISDEFLEWFVKNPSCKFVTVTNLYGDFQPVKYDYKIIIPQEESKTGSLAECIKGVVKNQLDTISDLEQQIKKYPIGGYAPGNYTCICVNCKVEFFGDKRAVQCEPCAVKMVNTKIEGKKDSYQIEKPKPILGVDYEYSIDDEGLCIEIPIIKQQTVEEIIEKMFPFTDDDAENRIITIKRLYWIDGVKWQQERSYNEEDLKEAFINGVGSGKYQLKYGDNAKGCMNFEYFVNTLKKVKNEKTIEESAENKLRKEFDRFIKNKTNSNVEFLLESNNTNYISWLENKWQQERSYNEEEAKKLAFDFYYDMSHKLGVPEYLITENSDNVDVWFKKYKNK
jgi:hypothetical protein